MATCKDCLHDDVCIDYTNLKHSKLAQDFNESHILCDHFKDKSKYAEVKRGKWKLNQDGSGTCDQCGKTQKNVWDYDNWQSYCGCCGAKMDGAT